MGFSILANYDTAHCTGGGMTSLEDPKISPLHDNGGETETHALLPGSPAIDEGNPGDCVDASGQFITDDQRGYHRPISLASDVGAFEYQFGVLLPLAVKDGQF